MVYVYVKHSELNKYLKKELTIDEIEDTLIDMGMDLKGKSDEKDSKLKIELTAEKLDLISSVGIARAINYYKGLLKNVPKYTLNKSNKYKIIVDKSASLSRPKIVACVVKDVPMTQELLDEIIKIQEKIHDSFGRGRKKAAIGIYPINKITFPIHYKSEEPKNIIFKPLGYNYQIDANTILQNHDTGKKFAHLLKDFKLFPVLRDSTQKILSMPPIINSDDTGRVEIEHKDLFIECTGFNINHLDNIMKILATTFIEFGAKIESVKIEYPKSEIYELNLDNSFDEISLSYINKLIGINIKSNDVEKYLNKMMYGLSKIQGDKLTVEIPCIKSDVWHDVDIADDVARGYGYNNIIPTNSNIQSVGSTLTISKFKNNIINQMIGLGYLELYTYMLSSSTLHFKNMNINLEKSKYIKLIDSDDQGLNMVRTMILPDNLESLKINRKNKYPQKIFECGFTIQPDISCDTGAKNETHLSVSIADPKSNYTQIKEVLDTLAKLNEFKFEIKPKDLEFGIIGRCAKIYFKGEDIGFICEISPQVLSNFNLLVPISSLELNLNKIFELKN